MKRFTNLILAAFLIVATRAASYAEDWTITPGQSVGPVKLGMRLTEVESSSKLLPGGTGSLIRKDTQTTLTPKGQMKIVYTRYGGIEVQWDPRAVQIIVTQPKTTTAQGRSVNLVGPGGVRVGSSLQDMEQALGRTYESRELEPQKGVYMYRYLDKNIGCVVKGGKVVSINIWPGKK